MEMELLMKVAQYTLHDPTIEEKDKDWEAEETDRTDSDTEGDGEIDGSSWPDDIAITDEAAFSSVVEGWAKLRTVLDANMAIDERSNVVVSITDGTVRNSGATEDDVIDPEL